MSSSSKRIYAGFIPLTDSAPLIAAHELGFAEREGLELVLMKETSWATIRDRLAVGHLDIAHALAPMPIAANLGLNAISHELIAPIALGTGGNTITVSNPLWHEMSTPKAADPFNAADAGIALAEIVNSRRAAGRPRLVFGIVHPHSAHHYELAYWLTVAGIVPARDVDLVVIPPPLMPAALSSGRIDGFCVGAPWGCFAVQEGVGHILTTKPHIWQSSPEKVLAMQVEWAESDVERTNALLRAVYYACVWCDQKENRETLAELLARDDYVGMPAEAILAGLGKVLPRQEMEDVRVDGYLNFAAHAATFPWVSHALWFYTQMVRWGQVGFEEKHVEVVRRTYRPDLYRKALSPLGIDIPSANAKVEGSLSVQTPVGSASGRLSLGSDRFFDGRTFDPDKIEDYVTEGFAMPDKGRL